MKYNQGDLINLKNPFKLPDGTFKKHLVLIISCAHSNSYEKHYTGVMMTSTGNLDRFSYPCENHMFLRKLEKTGCHLRLYILVGFDEDDVFSLFNQMHKPFYTEVIKQIKEMVFAV